MMNHDLKFASCYSLVLIMFIIFEMSVAKPLYSSPTPIRQLTRRITLLTIVGCCVNIMLRLKARGSV